MSLAICYKIHIFIIKIMFKYIYVFIYISYVNYLYSSPKFSLPVIFLNIAIILKLNKYKYFWFIIFIIEHLKITHLVLLCY